MPYFGTTITPAHDASGNLTDDGVYDYTYDPWNRLVKVQAQEDGAAVAVQTAEFDAVGRRMKKVVTNSGDFDGTVVYFYDGQKIVETRDGSGNVLEQFIRGTQYIDELVMMRVKGERSERKRAAAGKTSMDASVRPATCPEGVSWKRTTKGKGDLYVHQGEPGERKRAAIGKAGRTLASGPRPARTE